MAIKRNYFINLVFLLSTWGCIAQANLLSDGLGIVKSVGEATLQGASDITSLPSDVSQALVQAAEGMSRPVLKL